MLIMLCLFAMAGWNSITRKPSSSWRSGWGMTSTLSISYFCTTRRTSSRQRVEKGISLTCLRCWRWDQSNSKWLCLMMMMMQSYHQKPWPKMWTLGTGLHCEVRISSAARTLLSPASLQETLLQFDRTSIPLVTASCFHWVMEGAFRWNVPGAQFCERHPRLQRALKGVS